MKENTEKLERKEQLSTVNSQLPIISDCVIITKKCEFAHNFGVEYADRKKRIY